MNLRILDYFERGKKVKITVNEKILEAFEGECLSVVLFISNYKNLRLSPKKKKIEGCSAWWVHVKNVSFC